jgi:TonB family protein
MSRYEASAQDTSGEVQPLKMNTSSKLKCVVAPIVAILFSCAAYAEDIQKALDRLNAAHAATSLYSSELKPWYMKMDVELYDPAGKPTENGTIEEWWAGPDLDKRVYSFPSGTNTYLHKGSQVFRNAGFSYAGYFLDVLRMGVADPLPGKFERSDNKSVKVGKEVLGTASLDCISFIYRNTDGQIPGERFCFLPDQNIPTVSTRADSLDIYRDKTGIFQQRQVAIDQIVRGGSTLRAKSHLTALTARPMPDGVFATTGMVEESRPMDEITAGVVAGSILSKRNPEYPPLAKASHLSGTVVLHAIIREDGHIDSLEVLSTPNSAFSDSALAAVREWTYKPFLLNGNPTKVETTIRVNFNTTSY